MNLEVFYIQQIFFGALSLFFLIFLFFAQGKKWIDLRHALIWYAAGFFVFLMALFPQLLNLFGTLLGFKLPSNAVFSVAVLMLTSIIMLQSISLSRAKKAIREIAQKIAILEADTNKK